MEPDLQQQNAGQDQLNPLNYHDNADISTKEQDKRTVLNMANYGWAKHIGIKPSGHKYVLGYSPVDLKYTSVIQPLSVKHSGYIYSKPNVHFVVKRPMLQLRPSKHINTLGWKPIAPIKPVNQISPPPHHHHLVTASHGEVNHVNVRPLQQGPHINNVHQVQLLTNGYDHNIPVHLDYTHPATVQPVHSVPVPSGPLALLQPITPTTSQLTPSHLFEVTKPSLGVLPLGTTLSTSILKGIPNDHGMAFHLKPSVGYPAAQISQPPLVYQPHLFAQPALISQSKGSSAVSLPQPASLPIPTAGLQPTFPGATVEYHGATSFTNKIPPPQISNFHFQFPKISNQLPPHLISLQPHEQHDLHASHPHFSQEPVNEMQYHQQLPLETPFHFQPVNNVGANNIFHQQLPANVQHEQFHNDHNGQHFIQQISGSTNRLPDLVDTHTNFQGSINPQQSNLEQLENQEDGYLYQQPNPPFRQQAVQLGDTDLQLPLHLPQHHGFTQSDDERNVNESSQLQNIFKPSIQLEPPYTK